MVYNCFSKHVEFSCDDLNMQDEFDVDIYTQENFKDILAYYFEKKYEVPYTETSWVLEKDAREFVRDLENRWLNDEIDTFTLYHDESFLNFLKHRNLENDWRENEQLDDAYRDFLSDCEWEARALSKSELKELIDMCWGSIKVNVVIDGESKDFMPDELDLEEIYDEEYGDEDEEDEEEDED